MIPDLEKMLGDEAVRGERVRADSLPSHLTPRSNLGVFC